MLLKASSCTPVSNSVKTMASDQICTIRFNMKIEILNAQRYRLFLSHFRTSMHCTAKTGRNRVVIIDDFAALSFCKRDDILHARELDNTARICWILCIQTSFGGTFRKVAKRLGRDVRVNVALFVQKRDGTNHVLQHGQHL